MKAFPTLYKKTNTGAIQQWDISAGHKMDGTGTITTQFGQLGGAVQETTDYISEGKNGGKKNATSPHEQALKEAESKWIKQKKKGYVESIEAAQEGEVDDLIEGGIAPMLAHPFAKHAEKISYPAYTQPKFDGIRCIAVVADGKCSLWSRTRRPITGVPHVARALEIQFPAGQHVFDGELYNHGYKNDFEQIVSFVRQATPKPGHEVVQYHIYDLPSEAERQFWERDRSLRALFADNQFPNTLVLVQTEQVPDEEHLLEWFQNFTSHGYEGSMVRAAEGVYEAGKRSYGLQKVKDFIEDEFDIIGIEEGRGKLIGHVAAFVCRMPSGKEFKAKPMGELSLLRRYFDDHSLWEGKKLTVKYQNLSGDGKPRFPVGKAVRDYE